MRIGELARATGTKVETIRYYKQIGLLAAPGRTASNNRAYGDEHRQRLAFIRQARDLGFSINDVRELLRLSDQHDQSCEAADRIACAHCHVSDRKLGELTSLRTNIDRMIAQCRRAIVAECRIIEVLADNVPTI